MIIKSSTWKKVGVIFLSLLLALFLGIYAYVASLLSSRPTMSHLILGPVPGANQLYELDLVPGIKKKSIFINAVDGSKLHAWLFKVPNAKNLAIVSHGNAGNISNRLYLAKALTQAGCSVLLYDYRGYGISSGTCSLDGILQDGAIVYDHARKNLGYAPEKILLYGESIGTGVVCNLAAKVPCAGVVLQSGFDSLPSVGRHIFFPLWLFPDFIFTEPRLNDAQRVKELHVPVLIIHGKLDTIVPYQDGEILFANANQPKSLVLLPDCGHNDMGVQNGAEFQSALKTFVKSCSD
jgi:hypothetical protein